MNIHYICNQLVRILHCHIFLVDENHEIEYNYGDPLQEEHPFCTDERFRNRVSATSKHNIPEIICEEHCILYGRLSVAEKYILVGPVCVKNPTRELKNYMIREHHLNPNTPKPLVYCDMRTFGSAILMLHHCLTEENLSIDKLWRTNQLDALDIQDTKESISEVIFQSQERGLPHNPYDQEKREMDSIRKGNVQMLQKSLQETYLGEVGKLSKDELRQAKNIAICVIVLASRAAIEGGLLPEEAFSMVDAYILRIEEMTNAVKIDW